MNDCIFCRIVSEEVPSQIVGEGDSWLAFKDIRPSAPVHILVVTKEHIESVKSMTPADKDTVSELIFAAKDIAEKVGLKGYKLVFNVGVEGGQVIQHLHLHILGGWSRKEDIEAMPHPILDK